jgi:hypothetical protein
MPHRGARGESFGGVDDGVGVDAVVAVEIGNRAGLAEMLDAERLHAVAAHAAQPAERRGMAVEHGDDAAVARQRRQEPLDIAHVFRAAVIAADAARRGPAGVRAVRRGDRQQLGRDCDSAARRMSLTGVAPKPYVDHQVGF